MTRLRGVYLFGSYARDEADEDSDADVLIVLDRVDNYSRKIDATSELTGELSKESTELRIKQAPVFLETAPQRLETKE